MVTILIVDDHPLTRTVIHRRLEKEGFNVLEADNGTIGVELLRANDVDLVLLDFMMKNMNGMQTFDQMKFFKPKVPYIMITAYAHPELVKQFMKEGGAEFLVKPLRQDFEQRIKEVLIKHQNN